MWHRLSGLPDNVTDAGEIVEIDAGRRLSAEKALLRAAINELSTAQMPSETRGLARLAASYLLAGDAETARRYLNRARESIEEANHATD
jgi:ribosomal protein S20